MKLHKNLFLVSSLFISLSLLPSVHAATATWSGPGTTWDNTDTNWTGVTGTPWDITNGPNNTAIFTALVLGQSVTGDVYTNGITFTGTHTITANAVGTIHLAGTTPTLSAASGFTGTLRENLAGTSGFTKTGAGTIIINNATANSLTGEVSVNAGQLVIQSSANVAALATTATLSMTGGSLSLLGVTAPTTGVSVDTRSQTFGGTTISSGHSAISLNDNSSSLESSTPSSIILGAATRNAGATLNLSYTGAATTIAGRAIRSSSWTAGGTILDSGVAYATYATGGSSNTSPRSGDNWAASDTSGNVILATYTNNTATALAGNADVSATGNTNTTLATGASITSLRFSQAATRTVTITSGNLTTGGILVSSGIGNFVQTITGGTLRSAATVASKDLVVIQNNTGNDLVIASQIVNAAAGATGLTKSGAGRLSLTSSSNNYTGETRINEGTLRIGTGGSGGALSTSSAIVNNATLQFDRSAAMTQGTHFSNNISGTGSLSVERTTTVTLNSATNTFSGGVSIPVDGVLKLTHGAALGTGTLTIGNGNGTSHTARLELTNNITVTNAISLNGRGSSTTEGIRNVSGNNTLAGTITQFAGGGTGYIQSDSGLLTLGTSGSTAVTVGATGRTLVLRGAGNGNVAGAIQNNGSLTIGVTKDGTGTWTLSDANTYTGTTTVNQGTLTVASTGTLGASTAALVVGNNNTTAAGTDTILNLSTTADTVKGSLSGAILAPTSGTNTATINTGGSARNFTINQTTAGTFAGVIAGDGGLTLGSLSTNTLTLTGANAYTGQTSVSAGTLALGLNGTISNTLVMGSSTPTVGTLDVTAKSAFTQANVSGNGTLNIGAGKVISVTGALSPGFSPGTINVTGDLTLTGSTTTTMELAGNGGTEGIDSDDINVSGTITLDGILSIVGFGGYDPTQNAAYNLFDAATFTGDFDSVSVGGNGLSFAMDVWSGTYGLTTYSFSEATGVLTVVPEPRAALLGGLGMLALLRRRRA